MTHPSAKMVFVVGNSRSGTTMMSRVLGRNSAIHGFPELHYIEQMVTAEQFASDNAVEDARAIDLVARLISIFRLGYFKRREPERFVAEAQDIINKVMPRTHAALLRATMLTEARRHGAVIACEQTPRNVFHIDAILAAYPDAVVINMVRDPRDVLLSQKNKWRRRSMGAPIPRFEALRSWMNYHPLTMSLLWKSAVTAGCRPRDRVLTIRFEDLLEQPQDTLQKICVHVGVIYDQDMLNVDQINSSTRQDSFGTVGIDNTRSDAWRSGGLSASEITICERTNSELMKSLGYAQSDSHAGFFPIVFQKLLMPVKLIGALALNLGRVRNLLGWLRKRLVA
ncbi:sulfotransferase family protein [Roseinatronobacter sp. NSM]|uniref:sulfotransferase family protein n=1 Tax=Roseinatronobacter sp. NSM TaxID=3457785 RepID=UPI0040375251